MQNFIEDGIKRDALCWITDSRVGALCNYRTFGNVDIIKKCIVYYLRTLRENGWISTSGTIAGAHQHPENVSYMFEFIDGYTGANDACFYTDCGEIDYASYQADFLGMLYDYYNYSGDSEFVKKIWDLVRKEANYVCSLTDEMLEKAHYLMQSLKLEQKARTILSAP